MYDHAAHIENELRELHGPQMSQLDRAVERFEAGRAKLLRSDGTPVYAEQEHADRMQTLLAEFDGTTASVTEAAEKAITDGTAELAKLDGADPLDRLLADEQQAASVRAVFRKEDCETLPLGELAARGRAALAAGDRVNCFLLGRYLGQRLNAERQRSPAQSPDRQAVAEVLLEIRDRLADPKAKDKRHRAERRIESAKTLTGRVTMARRKVDGSDAAALVAMRRHLVARF